jgi:hypothetical protein
MAWAAGLGVLVALGDLRNWNAIRYRSRFVVDAGVTAVAIVLSIVLGCWLGLRMKAARNRRGEVA